MDNPGTQVLLVLIILLGIVYRFSTYVRGRRGRDSMVVGFTATYAISAYRY
jgi:hypothetical protein